MDLEDQFIGINIKQKVIITMQQVNLNFFLNQILLESMAYFLVWTNQDDASKRFKAKRYYKPKCIKDNKKWSSMEKTNITKQLIQI